MVVEIDQSGKVEQLDTHTVVAFSNGSRGAVYCTAAIKRTIYQAFHKSSIKRENLNAFFFAVFVYFAIRNIKVDVVCIDEEYTGKDSLIRETLEMLFSSEQKKYPTVNFSLIGKLSPAHRLAWEIHKKKLKNKATLVEAEVFVKLASSQQKSRDRRPHSPLLRRGSAQHPTLCRVYHKKSR